MKWIKRCWVSLKLPGNSDASHFKGICFLIRAHKVCFASSCTGKHIFMGISAMLLHPADRIEKRRKNPSTQQDSNPQPQEFCSAGMCSTAVLPIFNLLQIFQLKFSRWGFCDWTTSTTTMTSFPAATKLTLKRRNVSSRSSVDSSGVATARHCSSSAWQSRSSTR